MSNVQVMLDNPTNPTGLKFNPQHVQINNSPNPQTITWNLAGKLNNGGTFVANSLQFEGGLPGCMTAPVYSSDGQQVSLMDTNNAPGEWFYSLQVSWNGTVYGPSLSAAASGGTNSPSIQNN